MLTVKIDLNKLGIKNYNKELIKAIDQGMNDLADFIQTEAVEILKGPEGAFDTGFLARSITTNKNKLLEKEVYATANYAPYVEFGTRPHFPPVDAIYEWVWRKRRVFRIAPKKKVVRNGRVYYKEVLDIAWKIAYNMKKRGTEAHPFLRPAVNTGKSKVKEIIGRGLKSL